MLEKRIESFAEYLKSALNYLSSDPSSSLTKCRIILEKILRSVYFHEMGKESCKRMVGEFLSDREFAGKIPNRIKAKMNFAKDIANDATHGSEIFRQDAIRVLQDIVNIVEWYVSNYNLYTKTKPEDWQTIEILPQLKEIYPNYLKPDITSVKIGQTKGWCYLEITNM
jgi:hypothetical protein